jgi:hypothetical protein
MATTFNHEMFTNLITNYQQLQEKVSKRQATCRESSKKYYQKTFKLPENATEEQLNKQREAIEKRDKRQKSYYEANKEKILKRQKEYRARKKLEKTMSSSSSSSTENSDA